MPQCQPGPYNPYAHLLDVFSSLKGYYCLAEIQEHSMCEMNKDFFFLFNDTLSHM